MVRPLVYLAAPLFSAAELSFNQELAGHLEQHATVYLPQRDGGLVSEIVQNGVPIDAAVCRVFRGDIEAISRCHYVVAVLDGRAIDEGVAFELGVAFAQSKRCIGLQTDTRRLAFWGNNPMVSGALEHTFSRVDDLLDWIRKEVVLGDLSSVKKLRA